LYLQKIHSVASEVLKAAQVALDSAVKLCRAYFQTIKQETEMSIDGGEASREDINMDYGCHVVSITASI